MSPDVSGGMGGYRSVMRATLMYGAGDVRIETVPDAHLMEATDALVRVRRAAICGSDLWPYKSMEPTESGRRMGHEFIGVVEDVGTDVSTIKAGDVVVSPFLWSDGTCVFCREGLQSDVSTEAGTDSGTSTAVRARRYASRRQMGRSSSCRSALTTP
jgi:threonine dehydrogenase-like Zn-dependent dehydrogenase